MRKEEDCPAGERYLFVDEILSGERIRANKEEVLKRYQYRRLKLSHQSKECLNKYIDWKKGADEVVLFTLYAYADLSIPVKFDCLFNIDNPSEYIISELTVIQSIFEGLYPTDMIEDGHKHILICKFKDGAIPAIVNRLSLGDTGDCPSLSKSPFRMGICDHNNLPFISEALTRSKVLKENVEK